MAANDVAARHNSGPTNVSNFLILIIMNFNVIFSLHSNQLGRLRRFHLRRMAHRQLPAHSRPGIRPTAEQLVPVEQLLSAFHCRRFAAGERRTAQGFRFVYAIGEGSVDGAVSGPGHCAPAIVHGKRGNDAVLFEGDSAVRAAQRTGSCDCVGENGDWDSGAERSAIGECFIFTY